MPDPMHFEAHAEDYARARPPYPDALWDDLRDLGMLTPGLRALDLGAGTGQATSRLLAAGLRVTAVEPGPQLAAQIRTSFPEAPVIVSRAEDLSLPAGSFDLAVAATSIHWMDLDVVLPKVRRLLSPSGVLLVWRNVFGDPDFRTPFRDRIVQIVAERTAPPRPGPDAQDCVATAAALTETGLFRVVDTFTYRWSIDLDEHEVRALFTTFSDWSLDEVGRAADAVRELGGTVLEHYSSWLIVLRPTVAATA
ncbi:class I SAM-dependent methyltransferase [Microbacterium terricola]|uniref:class I SAM-dependent methyltransferase n=1 Tax=Microbacterium terricola TaxID=344163 RepID=UPI0021E79F1B|nr:class I SAM-dependent methyltransferase [Microbacterium terricola]UYK39993.1 class I SAM-dependent methyltransferase [Microbacterium terricola]